MQNLGLNMQQEDDNKNNESPAFQNKQEQQD